MSRTTQHQAMVAFETPFGRAIRRVFIALAILHAVLVSAQPIFAGMMLDGNEAAHMLHGINATVIWGAVLFLLVASILWWRPGGGTYWVPILTVIVFIADIIQPFAGVGSVLSVHIPLGVAILVGSLGLVALSLRGSPQAATTLSEVKEAV